MRACATCGAHLCFNVRLCYNRSQDCISVLLPVLPGRLATARTVHSGSFPRSKPSVTAGHRRGTELCEAVSKFEGKTDTVRLRATVLTAVTVCNKAGCISPLQQSSCQLGWKRNDSAVLLCIAMLCLKAHRVHTKYETEEIVMATF